MTESSKDTKKDIPDYKDKVAKGSSSKGDSPVDIVPKEASPGDATWKDRTERDLNADSEAARKEALVDEGSDLSFPASDPIAVSPATKIVKDKDGNLVEQPKDKS
jgi:hypothetical protein